MSADLPTSGQDLAAHCVLDAVEGYKDALDLFLQVWSAWQALCNVLCAACIEAGSMRYSCCCVALS